MTNYDPMHMINRTASLKIRHALLRHCVCLWGLSGLSAGCASVEAPDSEPDAMTSQMPMGSPFPGQNQQTDSFFTMSSTDAGVFPSQPSGNNMNGDEQCEPFSRLGPCSFCGDDGMPFMPMTDGTCPEINCDGPTSYRRMEENDAISCIALGPPSSGSQNV